MDDPGVQEGAAALPQFMWVDAAQVAELGVRGLERGRRVVVPGVFNRVGTWLGRHVNRRLLLWTARQVVHS
jgi:short-subunit dehydrogenase